MVSKVISKKILIFLSINVVSEVRNNYIIVVIIVSSSSHSVLSIHFFTGVNMRTGINLTLIVCEFTGVYVPSNRSSLYKKFHNLYTFITSFFDHFGSSLGNSADLLHVRWLQRSNGTSLNHNCRIYSFSNLFKNKMGSTKDARFDPAHLVWQFSTSKCRWKSHKRKLWSNNQVSRWAYKNVFLLRENSKLEIVQELVGITFWHLQLLFCSNGGCGGARYCWPHAVTIVLRKIK